MFRVTFVLLAVIGVLCAGGRAVADEAVVVYERSMPANPWVEEPARIGATLLFLPTVVEGTYRFTGVMEGYLLQRMFEVVAPDGMAVVGRVLIGDALKSVCRYDPEDAFVAEDWHLDAMRRYFGATHVVEISNTYDAESRTSLVRLHGPDGVDEASFEGPRSHQVASAHRVAEWLVERMGDVLTEDERARVLQPLHGRVIADANEAEWKALTDDAANPAWEDWIAEYPDSEYVRYMWVDRAATRTQREVYPRTVPPPGDGAVGPLYLGARGRVLGNMGHKDTAFHDFEIILARFPGITGQVNVYLQYWHDNASKRTRLVRNAELWHAQMPPAGAWDMLLARTHLMAARAWVDGIAEGLSPNVARRNMLHHAGKARDLIVRASERGGPVPELVEWGYIAATLLQDEQWFYALFNRAIREFPESIASYRSFMRYAEIASRQMTVDMVQAFLLSTLEHRADWLHATRLYDDYLLGFDGSKGRVQWEGHEGDVTSTVLRDWIAENEGWDEVTLAVARHIVRNDPTDKGAARAICYAWLAQDFDLLDEIVANHPRVIFLKSSDFGPVVYRTTVRHPMMNALRRADRMDVAFEYTTDLFENHQECCLDRWHAYQLEHVHAHHALFLAFQGRAEEADAHWEQAGDCRCLDDVQALSWAYSGHRPDEVRAHIARVRGEGRRSTKVTAAEIVLLAREGRTEEARALAEANDLPRNSSFAYIKRILDEALGGALVEE